MKTILRSIGTAAVLLAAAGCGSPETCNIDLIIGTYGEQIHMYSFDCESLEFTSRGTVEALNASYAIEQDGSIFAVSECGEGSGVYSFKEGETADLRQTGADPCFILLHEGYMMTADYSGGSRMGCLKTDARSFRSAEAALSQKDRSRRISTS